MTLFRVVFAGLIILMLSPSGAVAEPVLWAPENGGNGHYYEVVLEPVVYYDAHMAASSSEFMGMRGHLATITSEEENTFVASLAPEYECPALAGLYLGAIWMAEGPPLDERWAWLTGEPFEYTNWSPIEPNNYDERFLLLRLTTCPGVREHGEWNDGHAETAWGYVIEYEPTGDSGCAAELEQCLTDLDVCLASEPFLDEDSDGEADSTDACPGTPEAEEVDTAGCSQQQFCESQGPITTFVRILRCVKGDWKNDEAAAWAPRDCKVNWLTRECTIR